MIEETIKTNLEPSNDSFIIYNIEYDNEDFNITPIKAQRPDEDLLFLIGKDIEYINDLNIRYFNYIIFENDLEKLTDSEFVYFWKKFFEKWIKDISESYLEINLENFEFQLGTVSEKKFLPLTQETKVKFVIGFNYDFKQKKIKKCALIIEKL